LEEKQPHLSNRDAAHYSYKVYEDPAVAASFDDDRFGGDIGRIFRDYQEQLILRLIPNAASKRILDVGAGTGRISLPLSNRGAHVVATDASFQMLEIAKEKSFLNGCGIAALRSDAHRLPFRDGAFDYVISLRLLMHVIDWRLVIGELCRVAKFAVIIDFPPRKGFAGLAPLVHPLKRMFLKNYQPYRVFSTNEIIQAFELNHFSASAIDRHLVLPFGFHRLIGSPGFTRSMEKFLSCLGFKDLFGAPVTLMAQKAIRS
jgi:ubiquinone/menaquinone biosynthesis C-methylase UbiE